MECRKESRHSFVCDVDAAPPATHNQEIARTALAVALNISAGGVCILGELSIERFSVLPCQFHFPEVPVPIPILTQVRWIEPVESREGVFRIGLAFVA